MTEIYTNTFEDYEIKIDGLEYFCTFNAEAKEYSWQGTYFDPPEYEFNVSISNMELSYYTEDGVVIRVCSDEIECMASDLISDKLTAKDFI